MGNQRKYLTGEDFPVLARTWDNEDDAIYDEEEREADEGFHQLALEAWPRWDEEDDLDD